MANLSGNPQITTIDLYSSDTTRQHELGAMVYGKNGKAFRYVLAGGSALVVGNVLQSPAVDTQFDDMAVPAALAVGTTVVTITNGTTAVSAGDFTDGTLEVSVTPGLGEEYTIVTHGTATSGSAWVLTLDRPLRTAWTTSTKVTVRKSPYSAVIQCPTTLTGTVVGVAVYPIPASNYGWIQVQGVAAVLSDNSTGAVGSDVGVPGATAGCVGVNVAGTGKSNTVGRAMRALASGKTVPVSLCIG